MITETKENINIKKEYKINTFSEIFLINQKSIPRLYLYNIDSSSENLSSIAGKIAYYLQSFYEGHWISVWNKIVSDKYIEREEFINIINELKLNETEVFKDTFSLSLEKYWKPTSHIISEFVTQGLLQNHKVKSEVEEAISIYENKIDNLFIKYRPRINPITVNGNPALSITILSMVLHEGNLSQFADKYGMDKVIGLKVKDINSYFSGYVKRVKGRLGDNNNRDRLIRLTKNKQNQKLIESSSDDTLIIEISRDNKKTYDYIANSLCVIIDNREIGNYTDNEKDVLNHIYLGTYDRCKLVKSISNIYKKHNIINEYSINSKHNSELFLNVYDDFGYEDKFIFGNNIISKLKRNNIPKTTQLLSKTISHGFFDYNQTMESSSIKTIIINNTNLDIKMILGSLKKELSDTVINIDFIEHYKMGLFDINSIKNIYRKIKASKDDIGLIIIITRFSDVLLKLNVEEKYKTKTLLISENDIIKYSMIKDYEVIDNKVLEIYIKLGHIPYVLAQPLEITDIYIKMNIDRIRLEDNYRRFIVKASLYHNDGKLIRIINKVHKVKSDEVIPEYIIKTIIPRNQFKNKTILIQNNGYMRYKDKKAFNHWAKKINSDINIIEMITTDIPRIFDKKQNKIILPKDGTVLKLSKSQGILVIHNKRMINSKTYNGTKFISIKTEYPLSIEQAIYSYLLFRYF